MFHKMFCAFFLGTFAILSGQLGTVYANDNKSLQQYIKVDVKSKPSSKKWTARDTRTIDMLAGFKPYKQKKGEEYMSEGQAAHFTEILDTWKKDLMQEVDRTVDHMQDEAANFPDPADRATQEEEFSLELRTRDRERKLIKKIDDTLDLISSGEYGYCDTCGVEIGLKRLEARPTATQCIDCKSLDEIKEKQIKGK